MDSSVPKVITSFSNSDDRMHKKGITEEVAKKRSRKNVKVQVGHQSTQRGLILDLIVSVVLSVPILPPFLPSEPPNLKSVPLLDKPPSPRRRPRSERRRPRSRPDPLVLVRPRSLSRA